MYKGVKKAICKVVVAAQESNDRQEERNRVQQVDWD